jgi:hypothetical protein
MAAISKTMVSARISTANVIRLRVISKETRKSVSALFNEAVDEFLRQTPADGTGFSLNVDDLKRMVSVVEAMGKSLPVKLFLEIVQNLRSQV